MYIAHKRSLRNESDTQRVSNALIDLKSDPPFGGKLKYFINKTKKFKEESSFRKNSLNKIGSKNKNKLNFGEKAKLILYTLGLQLLQWWSSLKI